MRILWGSLLAPIGSLLGVAITSIGSLLGVTITPIRRWLVIVSIVVMWHGVSPLVYWSTGVRVKHHRPLGWGLGSTPLGPSWGLLGPLNSPTRTLMGETDGLWLTPCPPLRRRVRL